MKYLRFFEKDADYQQISSVDLPNVSHTVDSNMVYYNPLNTPSVPSEPDLNGDYVVMTFNAYGNEDVYFPYDSFYHGKMYLDGVECVPTEDYGITLHVNDTNEHKFMVEFNNPFTSLNDSNAPKFYSGVETYSVDFSHCDLSQLTDISSVYSSDSIKSINFENCDLSNLTYISSMAWECYLLEEIRMSSQLNPDLECNYMWGLDSTPREPLKFYYNSAYDYSVILNDLSWSIDNGLVIAVPCTLVDGVLIPNE